MLARMLVPKPKKALQSPGVHKVRTEPRLSMSLVVICTLPSDGVLHRRTMPAVSATSDPRSTCLTGCVLRAEKPPRPCAAICCNRQTIARTKHARQRANRGQTATAPCRARGMVAMRGQLNQELSSRAVHRPGMAVGAAGGTSHAIGTCSPNSQSLALSYKNSSTAAGAMRDARSRLPCASIDVARLINASAASESSSGCRGGDRAEDAALGALIMAEPAAWHYAGSRRRNNRIARRSGMPRSSAFTDRAYSRRLRSVTPHTKS